MNNWDGKERRVEQFHQYPLAECIERNKNIADKLDQMITRLDKINGRYEKHLEEAVPIRAMVTMHEERLGAIVAHRHWIIGVVTSVVFTLLIQTGALIYFYGQLTRQVEINTGRIENIETIHPRNNNGLNK